MKLPEHCIMIPASQIDMSRAMGVDDANFWNHHGNTKEDYLALAGKLPEVQQAMENGLSPEEIKNDPELSDTYRAYYEPDRIINVEHTPGEGYDFYDDGRHRVMTAQECGASIPVRVLGETESESDSIGEDRPESPVYDREALNRYDSLYSNPAYPSADGSRGFEKDAEPYQAKSMNDANEPYDDDYYKAKPYEPTAQDDQNTDKFDYLYSDPSRTVHAEDNSNTQDHAEENTL